VTGHRGSRVWHGILALVVFVSLVAQVGLILTGGQDVNAAPGTPAAPLGVQLTRFAGYFTIQSNVLVLVMAISLVVDPDFDGRIWRVLRLDALLGIATTGLVFVTVLLPLVHPTGLAAWVNAGLHYAPPLLALVGWLLFGPRPRVEWHTVAWAFVWPVLWLAYTFGYGAASDWYPYPFLDAGLHGSVVALRNAGLVLAAALLLAAVVKALDNRLRAVPA